MMQVPRTIDNNGIPPKGPDGKRIPLGLTVAPNVRVKPQPVGLNVGR